MKGFDWDGRAEEFLRVRASRSAWTRLSYETVLRKFREFGGGRLDEATMNRWFEDRRMDGVADSTLSTYRTILLNFAEFCDMKIKEDRVIKFDSDSVREDRIPVQDELRRIFGNADMWLKAAMGLQAFSALRFKPISKLKLKHLKDLRITGSGVEIVKAPLQIHIPKLDDSGKPFDKRGAKHETFLIREGCEYLTEYLNWRARRGEKLTPESYVIVQGRKPWGKYDETSLEAAIRRHMRKMGFSARPYILKKYCENRMLATPGLKESHQRFFTGWKAGRDLLTRYGLSVELPQELVEELRQEYARAEPYLTTVPQPTVSEEEIRRKAILDNASALSRMLNKPDLYEIVRKVFDQGGSAENMLKAMQLEDLSVLKKARETNGGGVVTVGFDELDLYLDQGYSIVAQSGDRYKLRRAA